VALRALLNSGDLINLLRRPARETFGFIVQVHYDINLHHDYQELFSIPPCFLFQHYLFFSNIKEYIRTLLFSFLFYELCVSDFSSL
jgi:hypothetical protein